MSLTKKVNGADVLCSPEEEAAIRAEWAAWTPPIDQRAIDLADAKAKLDLAVVPTAGLPAIKDALAALKNIL